MIIATNSVSCGAYNGITVLTITFFLSKTPGSQQGLKKNQIWKRFFTKR